MFSYHGYKLEEKTGKVTIPETMEDFWSALKLEHAADDLAWEKASADLKKAEGALTLLAAQLPH